MTVGVVPEDEPQRLVMRRVTGKRSNIKVVPLTPIRQPAESVWGRLMRNPEFMSASAEMIAYGLRAIWSMAADSIAKRTAEHIKRGY